MARPFERKVVITPPKHKATWILRFDFSEASCELPLGNLVGIVDFQSILRYVVLRHHIVETFFTRLGIEIVYVVCATKGADGVVAPLGAMAFSVPSSSTIMPAKKGSTNS